MMRYGAVTKRDLIAAVSAQVGPRHRTNIDGQSSAVGSDVLAEDKRMRISLARRAALAFVGCWAMAGIAAASASFNGLGFLPGGNNYSSASGVSWDGTVVVGTAGTINHPPPGSSNINRAFR